MGWIELAALFLSCVIAAVMVTSLATLMSKRNKHYNGVLELNNTDPDKPAYTLMIDLNCDLDNTDELLIRVTRN